jgi:hypothetical protein
MLIRPRSSPSRRHQIDGFFHVEMRQQRLLDDSTLRRRSDNNLLRKIDWGYQDSARQISMHRQEILK